MRTLKTIMTAGLFATLAATAAVAQQDTPANLGVSVDLREEVRNSFIFVFNDDVPAAEVSGRANSLASANGGRVTHVYTTAIKGFAAKMPSEAAARVAAQNPNIAYFEPDGIAFAFPKPPWAGGGGSEEDAACDLQQTPWGIARVGGPGDGTGSTAWVIEIPASILIMPTSTSTSPTAPISCHAAKTRPTTVTATAPMWPAQSLQSIILAMLLAWRREPTSLRSAYWTIAARAATPALSPASTMWRTRQPPATSPI